MGERLPASFLDRCGNLLIYAIEKEDQEREKERLKKKTRDVGNSRKITIQTNKKIR